ncbi:MAG: glycerate kinase [Eubacteriales bacterium]
MKLVVASDSFKGSLSAQQIGDIVERVAAEISSEIKVIKIPMADGGEGTVDCLIDVLNGKKITVTVHNPLCQPRQATYGLYNGTEAVMEMAEASGITCVDDADRNIMIQNTYGTGEMILDAIENGAETIYIGIGGSATNDGGMGMASAFGIRFLDEQGNHVEPLPCNFEKIVDVDASQKDSRLENTRIIVMSDVTNPLLGEAGAANVFGRQKGATEEMIQALEIGMRHYIGVVEHKIGRNIRDLQGAGAAGGLGAGLLAFTNAQLKSGIDVVIDAVSLEKHVREADIVITGEGRMDYQSAYGKVSSGVGKMCKQNGKPCIAIVGSMGENAEIMYEYGITSIMTTVNAIMDIETAMLRAEELYASAIRRTLRMLDV